MGQAALQPRTDALDVLVELLSELDEDIESSGRGFYDRICEALCKLTSMERAGIFLYDDTRKLVVPVGSHGVDRDLLAQAHGTLEETPVAQRALSEDRVVEVSDDLGQHVPPRYARFAGVTTLTCTPVAAGGRWLGVIFADRGGGSHFVLTQQERELMWTLGKTAALAASARRATSQQARARLLQTRLDLAREIHECVIQRLFGVSLVLGSDRELSEAERQRCAGEMHGALADLRSALSRPVTPPHDTGATLREEIDRFGRHYKGLPLEVEWEEGARVPRDMEPLAQQVLAEALRNAHKHAQPSRVHVRVFTGHGTLAIEVSNDGVSPAREGAPSAGMGLRLTAMEALRRGGVLEFGFVGDGMWNVRLVVPQESR